MLNILKSDFYKLKKSKAFWICAGLCIVMGVLMVVAYEANIQWDLNNQAQTDHDYIQALEMSKAASAVWGLAQFLPMNFNVLIVGVFIAVFVTSEFIYGTVKNTLSRGAGRMKVFFSKCIVCGISAVVMQVLFIGSVLTAGAIIWGFDPQGISTASSVFGVIGSQILVIVGFSMLFTCVSTAIRSNGGSIAVNILCATVISTVFTAIGLLLGTNIALNDYWIGGVVSKLASVTSASGDIIHGVIVAVAWGVASMIIGTALFKKQDVK